MENVQLQSVTVGALGWSDIAILHELLEKLRFTKDIDYFEKCFILQDEKKRLMLGVFQNGIPAGYCIYNRMPKYRFFEKLNIPEIQDLNVLSRFRRQGLATALIRYCEALALKEGYAEMGIGVGMAPSYGAAQRLYTRLGYIPDGNGVTYDRHVVGFGEMRPNDDHLSLMMVKALR